MKKKKFYIAITMVLMILGLKISSVIAFSNNDFFYTNKGEISQGEVLEMTLDISKIKYDEFEFKLSSNLDTNNIVINEDIKAESYNNDISINIDKSKTNLDKITFYYQVPQNSQNGTKIELVAQIIVAEEKITEQNVVTTNELTNNNTNTVENNITNNNTNSNVTNNISAENTVASNADETDNLATEIEYKVVENKKIDVKIIENKQKDNQGKTNEQINKDNLPNEKENENSFEKNDKLNNTNMPNNNETNKMSENLEVNLSANTNKSMQSTKVQSISYSTNTMNISSMPSQTDTAVYNGSSNNYLSNLEFEGENLNTTFNKENTTYFVQTNGKTELNVKVTAEDDESKIYVTGNDNLKTGENKILISVTAENGDVRYYRVFVTNN